MTLASEYFLNSVLVWKMRWRGCIKAIPSIIMEKICVWEGFGLLMIVLLVIVPF